MDAWVKTRHKIAGYPCIRRKKPISLKPAEYEFAMYGRRGQIYEFSPGRYRALCIPGLWQNSLLRLSNTSSRKASFDDELIFDIPEGKLAEAVKIMQIPTQWSAQQLKYCNIFSSYWR